MKVIIAGSRTFDCYEALDYIVKHSNFEITEVVSGTAPGADQLGEKWAMANDIPIKKFPANWNKHGKSAGFIRNAEMAKYADAAIIVIINKSKGSTHMKNLMEKENKPTCTIELDI
jgi:hypothetical protein